MTVRRAAAGIIAALAVVLVVGGCSSGSGSGSNAGPLRAAGRKYAVVFLHGSAHDLVTLVGKQCGGPTSNAAAQLQQVRSRLADEFHRPLDAVAVTKVGVRNVTATSGDAEATFNLPTDLAGNDNWVHYKVEGGKWVVSSPCAFPIGGHSSSSTATAPSGP